MRQLKNQQYWKHGKYMLIFETSLILRKISKRWLFFITVWINSSFYLFQSHVVSYIVYKDACMVNPGFKPVPPQLYFNLLLFFYTSLARKKQQIQNKAVEELVWMRVLMCKHLFKQNFGQHENEIDKNCY